MDSTAMFVFTTCCIAAILGNGSLALAGEGCFKTPVIFNFGDSNSDTGGYAAAHGELYKSPVGRVFFGDFFSNRWCDGRLIIDFLCFESPLMACCGGGGALYNAKIWCGQGTVCDKGKRYTNWDGVHYTDNANAVVAAQIASTNYSTPPLKFNYFCS
ncbi:PREDICTED: GDSL esterase/lipase At1g09390-like [Ipomoea nil]|uniref:GDSL esterase/lipase At1g09390-like n=1 Tax=Ipomoea nil TaxID=35883 RepID=UPI000900FF78|nr:PREDICTED: GDSL esterase/lipase At1g09390-like [Ipomoea nil]